MLKIFILLSFMIYLVGCNSNNLAPTGLMVEFLREADNSVILDSKPEFTWIVPFEATYQSAYQIQVASSISKLEDNEPDQWDSGKLLRSNSVEIEYGGSSLQENLTYYWRVRIWDNKNTESHFSRIQSFRTGVFGNYVTSKNKFISSLVKPNQLVKLSNSKYFIDFGKAAFGIIALSNIKVSREDTLIVHLGEKIVSKNRIDRDPPGNIRYQKISFPVSPGKTEYSLTLPANNRNTSGAAVLLPDSIGVIFPFRYCEIENYSQTLQAEDIRQKIYNYFFQEDQSSFTSSDTVLNQIWDLCKHSIKATSFAGLYIDGDRERIPYEADAYINQLGHYYTDREYSIGRLTNEYFIDHPTWPTEWILQTLPMFYNDFMFTGNIESIKYYYDQLKWKTLSSLAREDGLISSKNVTDDLMTKLGFSDPNRRIKDIVDWPPGQKDTGWELANLEGERDGYELVEINTVVNSFYYQNLKLMSKIAGQLGNSKDSTYYHNKSIKVKNTINEKLFDNKTGIYIDGENSEHSSLHANMFPLAFDIVPNEYKSNVIKFIKSRGMACSVYGAQYLLEGLYRAGECHYALSLLNSRGDRSWWNMIASGSTITTEAWDIKYKPNSDWNHAWGAAPANIIPGYMWGIRPTEPGYSSAIIEPQLAELQSSAITVPTIRGNINAEYEKDGKSEKFIISIPGNMKCKFDVRKKKDVNIYLNDTKILDPKNSFFLQHGLNTIIIK